MGRVGFVSLGCPKALVDSERILTELRAEGYDLVRTYDEADVVVVNTCGFITPAVEESLNAIGEALDRNGRVIVTGCLGERPEAIMARHPSVLAVTGQADVAGVMAAVREALPLDARPRRPEPDWPESAFPDLAAVLMHVIVDASTHAGHFAFAESNCQTS